MQPDNQDHKEHVCQPDVPVGQHQNANIKEIPINNRLEKRANRTPLRRADEKRRQTSCQEQHQRQNRFPAVSIVKDYRSVGRQHRRVGGTIRIRTHGRQGYTNSHTESIGPALEEHEFSYWRRTTGVSECSGQAKNINVISFSFFCKALKPIDQVRMELRNLMEGLFHLPQ